jgi:hypothetical protein
MGTKTIEELHMMVFTNREITRIKAVQVMVAFNPIWVRETTEDTRTSMTRKISRALITDRGKISSKATILEISTVVTEEDTIGDSRIGVVMITVITTVINSKTMEVISKTTISTTISNIITSINSNLSTITCISISSPVNINSNLTSSNILLNISNLLQIPFYTSHSLIKQLPTSKT